MAVIKTLYANDYKHVFNAAKDHTFAVHVLRLCHKLEMPNLQVQATTDVKERFLTPESVVDVLRVAIEGADLDLCHAVITFTIEQCDAISIMAPDNLQPLAQQLQILFQSTLEDA